MADHSQKWHDGSSNRNIESSSNFEGIVAIVNKLENLSRDIKKLKENVHAIQIGCQICEGAHFDKDFPLKEEVKSMEEVKYGEFGRPFPNNNINDGRFNRGGYDQPSSEERRPSLTEMINKYMEKESKRHAKQDEWLMKFYQRFFDNERQETDNSGMAEALAALEATLRIKKEEPKEEKQSDLVENKPRTKEDEEIRMNPRCSDLLQNHLPPKEQDPGSFILLCSIGKLDFNNALADLRASINVMPLSIYGKVCKMTRERILKDHWKDRFGDEEDDLKENLEDPEECGEDKANAIMGTIHWFNNKSEDEDDLEGILDYLEPRSYDGFINLDDETYN
ncbi:hypothetical protein Tco_0097414 [Tanacetum coccineum]